MALVDTVVDVDSPTAAPAPSTAVDVVISCHDKGDLILGAVESALAQTYLPQTVVIVDDGSTDPVTLRALDTLEAANNVRVVVIRQSNQHVSAARNNGIAASAGPFIAVLDGDDRLEPQFLAATVAALEASPTVVAASSWLRSYGLGDWVTRPGGGPVTEFLARNNSPAEMTFRRDDWARHGGYSEEMTAGYEDWDFCLRLLSDGGRIEIIEQPLIRYRTDAASMNLSGFARRLDLIGAILDRHPDLYARYLREALLAKEQIAIDRLTALIGVFSAHPELDPGPVTYGDGGMAARVLIDSARLETARLDS